MSYTRVYYNSYQLYTTFVTSKVFIFLYNVLYSKEIFVVNCICKMFYYYIIFSLTSYISCYICCIVLLSNKGDV